MVAAGEVVAGFVPSVPKRDKNAQEANVLRFPLAN